MENICRINIWEGHERVVCRVESTTYYTYSGALLISKLGNIVWLLPLLVVLLIQLRKQVHSLDRNEVYMFILAPFATLYLRMHSVKWENVLK